MKIYLIVAFASIAYIITTRLALRPCSEKEAKSMPIIPAASFGILCHVFTLFNARQDIEQFKIMAMMSLLALAITSVALIQHAINKYRLPVAVVTAFSSLAVFLPFLVQIPDTTQISQASRFHIVLAMAAYVSISFASLFACLTVIQTKRLKHNVGLTQLETPLFALETLMIRSTLFALTFLIISLVVSGWLSPDTWTPRHQYKILFGAISWIPLFLVLFRYHFKDIRGQKSAYWTLLGTGIAFLGYFVTGFMR